jgi:hypothetical protein
MRMLTAAELLAVWEEGAQRPPVEQALLLLAAACSDTSPDALASLSLGQRDARLLALRGWLFDPQLTSLVVCPECGDRQEISFDSADIGAQVAEEAPEMFAVNVDGYAAHFRLPNSEDIRALAGGSGDVAASRSLLLARCLQVERDNAAVAVDRLPPEVVDAIVERMAEADPQADVQLSLTCPACGHNWLAALDIVSFFWTEIDAWARRILRDVHSLASAYGWREADILALSVQRRQAYLDMIGGL